MGEDSAIVALLNRVECDMRVSLSDHANAEGLHGASSGDFVSRADFDALVSTLEPLINHVQGLIEEARAAAVAAEEAARQAEEAAAEAERSADETGESGGESAQSDDGTPPGDDDSSDLPPDRRPLLDRPIFKGSN